MDKIVRNEIGRVDLLGRAIWKALGQGAPLDDTVSIGFARFDLEHGKMLTHKHEREVVYVIDAVGASARYGIDLNQLSEKCRLNPGDLLRFGDEEWHIFEMEDENSYLDILFIYSVPQNHTTYADR